MNFDLEKILYILPIVVVSIAQIFLMIFGNTDKATKLEQKKQKYIKNLTKRRDKAIKKGQKIQEKINNNKGEKENAEAGN